MTLFANALREASRLTEAGRLMEATAAIQRMLAGNATAAATASAADDVGLTIQGSAKRVGEHQATHSFASRPAFSGRFP